MFNIVLAQTDMRVTVCVAVNWFHRLAMSNTTVDWMQHVFQQITIHTNVHAILAFTAMDLSASRRLIAITQNCAMIKDGAFKPHLDFNVFVMAVSVNNNVPIKTLFRVFFQINSIWTGYIGNGTYCTEPYRQDGTFLLLSQGVAILKFATDQATSRGSPIAMSGVRSTTISLGIFDQFIFVDTFILSTRFS